MTKQEVKDEMRSMEGDPVKEQSGASKSRSGACAMQRLKKEVPKADVVVTNPTHFSVVRSNTIKSKMRSPKAHRQRAPISMAFRIRELAVRRPASP